MSNAEWHNLKTANSVGLWLSVACVVHCLSVPLLLILLPMTALDSLNDPRVHQIIAVVGSLIGLFAIGKGFRQHKNISVIALGLFCIVLLNLSAFCPDLCCTAVSQPNLMRASLVSTSSALWTVLTSHLSVAAGILMAVAHLANQRALNSTNCDSNCHFC